MTGDIPGGRTPEEAAEPDVEKIPGTIWCSMILFAAVVVLGTGCTVDLLLR